MEHKECVFSDYAIQRFAWLIYEGMKDERRKQIEAEKREKENDKANCSAVVNRRRYGLGSNN